MTIPRGHCQIVTGRIAPDTLNIADSVATGTDEAVRDRLERELLRTFIKQSGYHVCQQVSNNEDNHISLILTSSN